ncbi:hypothetical protein PUMCH_002067 [Australozyma saopauloensis]|uniref:Cell wall synthesis protein KRE9 n=1 Tax=Australozyma saopauloensis TaxID=291208 RepID=A0AAX4H863_9ASCO|nr:hypothetical protein PUMCH_002067 [[Candida] saopauloensis]
MHIHSLYTLLLLLVSVVADVSITKPTAGQSFSGLGGTTITVLWIDDTSDSDSKLSLSKVTKYSIVLCTGSNNNINAVKSYTTTLPADSLTYDMKIQSSDVPNGIYFVQVYAQFADGFTIHYTPRFTLTGMSGLANTLTFPTALLTATGDVPQAQLQVGGTQVSVDSHSFTVPYTLQTGKTRYAPMQTQPGTQVTYTMYSTRLPTSAYTPYSSLSPSPNVYSTITPGWSYAVTSLFNTAAIAAYPTYWYPASERVLQASLSSAKLKRWL